MRRTKIVCTIGPATESEETLEQLIDAGMNVARLNFSHGTHDSHRAVIETIRSVAERKSASVAILQDLAGPKIRIGEIANEPVELKYGDMFHLTTDDVQGDQNRVSVSYKLLPKEVQVEDHILLADGSIELRVQEIKGKDIVCKVIVGGLLSSKKGLNLPGRSLSIAALTDKDRDDLEFGLEAGVDLVAMSFVRNKQDIFDIVKRMDKKGKRVPVIAKIEKHEAIENIDEILEVVDGIMIARGDLAVETALERVPLEQKRLIHICLEVGKPIITATQMLKSMVDNPRPTRAEANDVANAVLDGTDAVMLSEETAVGNYPVRSVETMSRIIVEVETSKLVSVGGPLLHEPGPNPTIQQAISHAATHIAKDVGAAAIITPTQSGSTARMVSRYRPKQPIIALSPLPEVVRCLSLVWGIHPMLIPEYEDESSMSEYVLRATKESGVAKAGDIVIITAGIPIGQAGSTNLIKAEVIS